MSYPNIVYGDRTRYLPDTDTIELSTALSAPPDYIQTAHELGHRDGVLRGEIPKEIITRSEEISAEKYAWKYAIKSFREQGLWDEYAESWVRKGFAGHGVGAMNIKELDAAMEEVST